jgi:adenine-specific DNA-methyltransferase
MAKKQKLELTWIGKENRPRLEPRILIEDKEKSYHAPHRVTDNDIFDNKLIFGDNLLALKALEQEYAGKVKCIYIDPPYNTGTAWTHYDDGIEHSLWLSLMRDRLEILRNLLTEDGSMWISIDADESHYLKVLCDEVFGRNCYVDEVVWQRSYSPINLKKTLSRSHDNILVYCKNSVGFSLNKLPRSVEANNRYKNPDNDPRGPWKSSDLSVGPIVAEKVYEITVPSGRKVLPPDGYCWRLNKKRFQEYVDDNRIWFGESGNNVPSIKRFLSEVKSGITAMTLWSRDEVGDSQEAKREIKVFNSDDVFETPKQERLIERVILLGSDPGDLVLDSFLGSGTTAAVAHKMRRRWIGIELGEHCHTHCIPRLKKVIDGEDQGGISKAVNWQGGGGFRYYKLGPTLIVEDEWGNPVINKEFNAAMLAEAMCKLEGFTFNPDPEIYWQQGQSTETDFIYVTTQFMSREMLMKISEEVGPNHSLLICCGAFRCDVTEFANLTIKKIPKAVLKKCEWGHDDYSLEVENLPEAPAEYIAAQQANNNEKKKQNRKFGKDKEDVPSLFDWANDSEGGE